MNNPNKIIDLFQNRLSAVGGLLAPNGMKKVSNTIYGRTQTIPECAQSNVETRGGRSCDLLQGFWRETKGGWVGFGEAQEV